jgi:excisionase family DNA binding protein
MTEPLETIGLEDAARLLRLAPSTLRKRAAAGRLPGAKIGRQWVFVRTDLVELIRQQAKERERAYRSVDVAALRFDSRWRLEKGASKLVREIASKHRGLLRRRQGERS